MQQVRLKYYPQFFEYLIIVILIIYWQKKIVKHETFENVLLNNSEQGMLIHKS